MRRIISCLLVIFILVSSVCGVFANDFASINAIVEVDAENKMIRISGTASGANNYVTVYLLRPGKKISDIKKAEIYQKQYRTSGRQPKSPTVYFMMNSDIPAMSEYIRFA